MTVERSIKIIADDGETVIGELSMQDGGLAAEVDIQKDWFTPANLRDIGVAVNRMANLIESEGGV